MKNTVSYGKKELLKSPLNSLKE